jgi:tetratricopeptide (TPR) repeat protein
MTTARPTRSGFSGLFAFALAAIVVAPMFAARPALAEKSVQDLGKELADEAAALFKEGKFLQAAELFERAFSLNPEKLVRLRNAGRAFEEAGRLEHARYLFERYLELAPPGPERDEVVHRLSQLKSRLEAAAAPAPAPPPAPVVAPAPAPAAAIAAPPPMDAVAARSVDAPSRAPAWATAATGVAAAVVGTAWLMQVASAQEALDADEAAGKYVYPGGSDKAAKDRDVISINRWGAYGTLGLGAAALVAGLTWAVWPQPAGSVVAVLPWGGPDSAGMVAAVRF